MDFIFYYPLFSRSGSNKLFLGAENSILALFVFRSFVCYDDILVETETSKVVDDRFVSRNETLQRLQRFKVSPVFSGSRRDTEEARK